MKIILQADKNFRDHPKFPFLCKNINRFLENGNDYNLYIDDDVFISYLDLKINKLRKILDDYPDDEVIMCVDAFDTITVAPDLEIEQKFLNMNIDILHSVEKNCWPDEKLKTYCSYDTFINAGCLIFKNAMLKKYLDFLSYFSNAVLSDTRLLSDDQYLYNIFAFPTLNNIKIKADTENQIFQSLIFENLSNFEKQNNRFLNKITNTQPCVFHGNGTDGFDKINTLFGFKNPEIALLNWLENKNGMYFTNASHPFDDIYTKVKVFNKLNEIIYETEMNLQYMYNYYISLRKDLVGRFKFMFYDIDNNLIAEFDNEYEENIFDFLNKISIN
jgi:hypothetical protein